MLSVLSSVSAGTHAPSSQPQQVAVTATRGQQFADHANALETFSKVVIASAAKSRVARLQCTVPTWSPHDDHSLSLDDLHDLRTRALCFVHNLLTKLRAAGIQASYQLAPSSGSTVTLRALTTPAPASTAYTRTRSPSPPGHSLPAGTRDTAVMLTVDGIPTLALS
ncbi:hypothetical protein BKA62DRAFT_697818 [Auriculariales sp. MPI-PUGE-AT-0066]|nr:hypothetical protein BKA62DRAFT_697818 [Auriculariales sp. MPI-PUGE-AT-0066]